MEPAEVARADQADAETREQMRDAAADAACLAAFYRTLRVNNVPTLLAAHLTVLYATDTPSEDDE